MRNHSGQTSSRADHPDGLDGGGPSEATVGEVVGHSGLTAKSGVWSGKIGGALRRRSLAASSRTGQFARSKAWTQIGDFARRAWPFLAAMPVVFVVAMLPLAIELDGALREAVITAAVVSGVWFDVLLVFVATGSGNQVMGAIGEVWTAQELRRLRRSGWVLVNRFMSERWGDVDHVLVGPGGVVVVETKWSGQSWQLDYQRNSYAVGSLRKAANQAQQARKELATWIQAIAPGIQIMSVAVLWSTAPSDGDGWTTWRDNHTVIVQGSHFRQWLRESLPSEGVAPEVVNRVWSELDRRVEMQDQESTQPGRVMPLTICALASEWILKPLLGSITAIYCVSLSRFAHNWWLVLASAVAAITLGLLGLRIHWLRRVALGWSVVSITWFVAVAAILVRDLVLG
jgi:Holliday junction resolvase-like predicted endonuclease